MAPKSWPLAWLCAAVTRSCGWAMRTARNGDGDKIGGFDVSNDINNAGKTIPPSYSVVFPSFRTPPCAQKTYYPINKNQGQFNGVTVRKGTVGAFLANARLWLDDTGSSAGRAIAEHDILDALPALHALGLFDILQVRDAALRELVSASAA
ncbi:hypothetical protein [Janthinobacterium sp. MDT1-19]|uniref:hypothetical protein n=1 Tax=Janthinobacterium sp. MDT1-19 TaxID=1259339 RepID=UPI003F2020FB